MAEEHQDPTDDLIVDLKAERAVLGAIMLDPRAINRVVDMVQREDFYRPAHRAIWDALVSLRAAGTGIDYITIRKQLIESGGMNTVGSQSYLLQLLGDTPAAVNVQHYAEIVREYAALRHISDIGMLIHQECREKAKTSKDRVALANRAQQRLFDALRPLTKTASRGSGHQTIGQAAQELFDQLEATTNSPEDGRPVTATTTFRELDRRVQIPYGALTVVAGETGSGKSSLVRQIAFGWEKIGRHPHLVATEDRNWNYLVREVACRTRMNGRRVRDAIFDPLAKPTETEMKKIVDCLVKLMGSRWTINDTPGLTVEQVAMQAREAISNGADCIIVETFTRIKLPKWPGATKLEKVDHNIHVLTDTAQELNVPFIVTAHIKRIEPGKIPTMHDIRDSGNWENNARLILIPHRRNEKAMIIIGKANHDDASDNVRMIFDGPTTTWREPGYQDMM